jgi:MoxR-like ATPase
MSVATLEAKPASPATASPVNTIQKLIADAQKGAVDHLVDARFVQAFAGILPQLKTTMETEAAKHLGKLQTAALQVVDVISKAETGLQDRVRELAVATIAELAPRAIQVVDQSGLVRGSTTDHVRPEFDRIVQRLMLGLNVMLVGPAGSGKTTVGQQVADCLGLQFGCISLTAGVSESRLVGRFAPMGEGGKFEYVETDFVRIWRDGGVMVLDEVDAADPNVLLCLNAALANKFLITPDPKQPRIKRHKDCMIIACANTWGSGADREYVGRNQLDVSTLDRFCASQFKLDYDEKFESAVGEPSVVEYFHDIRRQVRQMKIRRVVSSRIILDGSLIVRSGGTLDEVKESFFLPWTEAERNAVGYCE